MITFVCDDGSRFTKIAWQDPKTGDIQVQPCSNSAKSGRSLSTGKQTLVETEGKEFTFSEAMPSRLKTHSKSYQYGDHSRAAIWFAMHELKLTDLIGDDGARCVATLPISDYYNGEQKNTDNINRKIENLKKPVFIDGVKYQFKEVNVYPEGLPVAASVLEELVEKNGQSITKEEKTLIIDIGGTTTDVALMYGANDIVSKVKSIRDVSGNTIEEMLRAKLAGTYSEIEDQALEAIIINGGSKSLRITKEDAGLDQIIDLIGERLTNYLEDIVGDPRTISQTIIVGGPSKLFVPCLKAAGYDPVINPSASQTLLAETIFKIEAV